MTVDFEEEARITETVARRRDGKGGRLMPLLLGATALCVLAYAAYVSFGKPSSQREAREHEEFKTASRSAHLHLDPGDPLEEPDNKLVIAPPAVPIEQPAVQPVVVTAPPVDDTAARLAAEEAERARKAEELRQARLRSSMIVVDQGQQGTMSSGFADPSSAAPPGLAVDDDPNRKFAAAVSAQDVETVRASRNDRIDALIPQGTLIRGVLETAIQSDLPGMVRAVVSTDVYSFDGRRVLLPKGTMLTGEYKSGLSRGQTRVLIIWTRALRSDGTSVALGSYGTDDLGRSGLNGVVDKHFLERFGAASMLSLVGGVSSFIAGLNADGSSSPGSSPSSQMGVNAQTQAQQTVSQTMAEMANMALKESINIPPTIHVDQGKPIMVFVRRDLDFSALYSDPVKEALHELRPAPSSRARR
ncbi:type IV secretion system protein VirB10 [Agrobacterium larrymoorei]|uniref:Type IV secretion system protein VirB10 n=1 Tax=Agrobacterium larrymoorei TaxID=160699 RepID=A0AAJ2BIX1_9HYPH|nr:type IV secretion system protein VirB10 [Agrobacterium larrymoorei]MDR6100490.1 type IV secretion system protein VirB10 [Agrobacterium larrymoorei]